MYTVNNTNFFDFGVGSGDTQFGEGGIPILALLAPILFFGRPQHFLHVSQLCILSPSFMMLTAALFIKMCVYCQRYKLQDIILDTYIFCLASNLYVVTELLFFSDSQIGSNGIVAFEQRFTGSPRVFPFPDLSLIAPFWDVVDIERFGDVFYRITSNVTLLQRAHVQLQELFPSSGNFTPTILFIATWDRVAQFGGGPQV